MHKQAVIFVSPHPPPGPYLSLSLCQTPNLSLCDTHAHSRSTNFSQIISDNTHHTPGLFIQSSYTPLRRSLNPKPTLNCFEPPSPYSLSVHSSIQSFSYNLTPLNTIHTSIALSPTIPTNLKKSNLSLLFFHPSQRHTKINK